MEYDTGQFGDDFSVKLFSWRFEQAVRPAFATARRQKVFGAL